MSSKQFLILIGCVLLIGAAFRLPVMLLKHFDRSRNEHRTELLDTRTDSEPSRAATESVHLTARRTSPSSTQNTRQHQDMTATISGEHPTSKRKPSKPALPETKFEDMDLFELTARLQDQQISDTARQAALTEFLEKIHQEESDYAAFDALQEVKDVLQGEGRQFVLKALNAYPELGGNAVIVDSFVKSADKEGSINRARMLSYLNPRESLDTENVDMLTEAYFQTEDSTVRQAILGALATTGGDYGVEQIIAAMRHSKDTKAWASAVMALSRSGSPQALNHLGAMLNDLAPQEGHQEEKETLRQAILQLKQHMEQS